MDTVSLYDMLEELEGLADVCGLSDDEIDFVEIMLDKLYVNESDLSALSTEDVKQITSLWRQYFK
jgi:hypothetical protein